MSKEIQDFVEQLTEEQKQQLKDYIQKAEEIYG